MNLKLSMKLSQQLRMTPQLQQAIKLLQMSRLELEHEVRRELIENPVLEEVQEVADDDGAANKVESPDHDASSVQDSDPTKQDEFEWENYVESQYKNAQTPSGLGNEEIQSYENVISTATSLHDHLNWQVSMTGFNEEEQQALSILIDYVDDDGYLKTPLADIAQGESVSEQDLVEMLPFLQELDPPGVGARDLKECLLIQARHMQEDTHDMVTIIENHLKDLERKNYLGIAQALGLEMAYVVDLCAVIFDMDPKPGRIFHAHDTQFITPDVYVYKMGDDYVVSLNEDGLPRLRISTLYKNLLQRDSKTDQGQAQDYIQDKLRSALWLIKSIHQRQRTIYKVAESIVRYQREFLDLGPEHIKPMVLRDIANDIGMHESTVSRVTTAKYIHTPRGIYELKYFFNSGISTNDGDSVASESVKIKIRDMVAAEDPRNPLSDQKIVELLGRDGINIARRTVAKYRDVLKILSSAKRKKFF